MVRVHKCRLATAPAEEAIVKGTAQPSTVDQSDGADSRSTPEPRNADPCHCDEQEQINENSSTGDVVASGDDSSDESFYEPDVQAPAANEEGSVGQS